MQGTINEDLSEFYLEFFQLRCDGPLRLSEGGVATFDAVVHLRHAVSGAVAAICATPEHSPLRERTGDGGERAKPRVVIRLLPPIPTS